MTRKIKIIVFAIVAVLISVCFKKIYYSVDVSKDVIWCGSRGNELFVSYRTIRGYTPFWYWEEHISFTDTEVWFYKYDLQSKSCIYKKNIGKLSEDCCYVSCFVNGGDKLYLCKYLFNKEHVAATEVYDLNNFKLEKTIDGIVRPTPSISSCSYIKSLNIETNESDEYVYWLGAEKDYFVRDEDIEYMKSKNEYKVKNNKYMWSCEDSEGYCYRFFYNNNHILRRLVVKKYDVDHYYYNLIDEATGVDFGGIKYSGFGGHSVNYYDDSIYNVYLFEVNGFFEFTRYNFITKKLENIMLPVD